MLFQMIITTLCLPQIFRFLRQFSLHQLSYCLRIVVFVLPFQFSMRSTRVPSLFRIYILANNASISTQYKNPIHFFWKTIDCRHHPLHLYTWCFLEYPFKNYLFLTFALMRVLSVYLSVFYVINFGVSVLWWASLVFKIPPVNPLLIHALLTQNFLVIELVYNWVNTRLVLRLF